MKQYDVIVIGSGGGSKITTPASKLGLRVAVIEKDRLGGTCLNRGCIPSKMLIHPADVAQEIRDAARFDIHNNPNFTVDFNKLVTRISNTVDADSYGISAGYGKNPNIDFYHGTARFTADKIIAVNGEELTADKIFVAVGSRPGIPDIQGITETPYWTSTEALRNTALPRKMTIIGASYIAVELGHAYGALGTEVHFLVRSRFLRQEDQETAAEFSRVFAQRYDCHFGAVPERVEHRNGRFRVAYQQDGDSKTMMSDALLIATGVVPNTDTLDLHNTSMELTDEGYIRVDDYLCTSIPGVYAMGDCIGRHFFRHTVNFEGEYLFRSVFKESDPKPLRYRPVPHAIFSNPQVAGVGKTEEELKAEGVEYVAAVNPYKKSAMGMALLSDHGFCKLLLCARTRKILGAHIVGPEASNMLHMIIAFMNKDGTLDDLLNMIYIHPALPEIVRNTARNAQAEFDKRVAQTVSG